MGNCCSPGGAGDIFDGVFFMLILFPRDGLTTLAFCESYTCRFGIYGDLSLRLAYTRVFPDKVGNGT